MSIEMLTVRQAAQALQVSRQTIYRLVQRGELPAYRIGADLRLRKADIEEYLERQKVPVGGPE